MVNSLGEWMVESKPPPPTFANESLAGPIASYVLDASTGNELSATSEALQGALDGRRGYGAGANGKKDKDVPPHCVWIAASRRSIRAAVNVNGERFAKVELGEDEAFQEVFYITRHGMLPLRFGDLRKSLEDKIGHMQLKSRPQIARGHHHHWRGHVFFGAPPAASHADGAVLWLAGVSFSHPTNRILMHAAF